MTAAAPPPLICPSCGCNDAEILSWPDPDGGWFHPGGTAQCRHCGRQFHWRLDSGPDEKPPEPPPRVAQHLRIACPQCGQRKSRVTKTENLKREDGTVWAILRRYTCKVCRHNFKWTENQ
jgi:hypothetical protein